MTELSWILLAAAVTVLVYWHFTGGDNDGSAYG